ncbi:MAG TPA: exosortase/archaeosortase family protein [Phycisphaerae bacterium]|nr:exosortase/archaeosortase family protein [Phycisphaerae bacterium]
MRTTPDEQATGARAAGRRSLADRVAPAPAPAPTQALGRQTLIRIGVLGALMVAAHLWQLHLLAMQCYRDPDWRHGFVIPLFSLYLLYSRRDELLAAPRRTGGLAYLGLAILVFSLLAQPLCVFPIRNYWLMQISMVWSLFGLVLYLGGAKVIRLTWVPILFLLFALPISPSIYTRISVPLQNISAAGAVGVLKLLRVPIDSVASTLTLTSKAGETRALTVAEACNGMRLLTAFLALAVAMAYLDERPIWQRVILVAAGVPIAVVCNMIRVAITCHMYYIDKEEMGQDFMHFFTGMLMLIPAFGMLWVLSWMLRAVCGEEDEEDQEAEGDPDAAPAGEGTA